MSVSVPDPLADEDDAIARLAIGCFASICHGPLADDLIRFGRRCPEVDVGVHEMPRPALLPALRAGTLSLVILPGPAEPDLPSLALWDDEVMLAMPRDHPLAAREAVHPSALRQMVLLVSRQPLAGEMHRFLARRIFPLAPLPDAQMLGLGPARLIDEVAAGRGVALMGRSLVDEADERVVLRPIDAPQAHFPVIACWRDAAPAWPLSEMVTMLRGGGEAAQPLAAKAP